MPPSIPGLGSQGGFSLLAAGSQRRLDREPRRERCRSSSPRRASGPSWPASTSPFSAAVPQVFADVDRDKVLQAGRRARRRLPDDADVSRRALREPVQPLRPAVARVPAGRGRRAHQPRAASAQFYVRNNDGADGAAVGAADDAADVRPAVHQPLQRLPRRAGHRRRGARLQLGPGARRARGGRARRRCRRDISYDWADLSYPGAQRLGQRPARLFALSLVVRVPDPRGALRELVAAVLGAAVGAGRGVRRVRSACCCASSTSTSTRRSASSC